MAVIVEPIHVHVEDCGLAFMRPLHSGLGHQKIPADVHNMQSFPSGGTSPEVNFAELSKSPMKDSNPAAVVEHKAVTSAGRSEYQATSNGPTSKQGRSFAEHIASVFKSRQRHTYNPYQMELLEAIFLTVKYPDRMQKLLIASRLGISAEQVKIWFQNRRRRGPVDSCDTLPSLASAAGRHCGQEKFPAEVKSHVVEEIVSVRGKCPTGKKPRRRKRIRAGPVERHSEKTVADAQAIKTCSEKHLSANTGFSKKRELPTHRRDIPEVLRQMSECSDSAFKSGPPNEVVMTTLGDNNIYYQMIPAPQSALGTPVVSVATPRASHKLLTADAPFTEARTADKVVSAVLNENVNPVRDKTTFSWNMPPATIDHSQESLSVKSIYQGKENAAPLDQDALFQGMVDPSTKDGMDHSAKDVNKDQHNSSELSYDANAATANSARPQYEQASNRCPEAFYSSLGCALAPPFSWLRLLLESMPSTNHTHGTGIASLQGRNILPQPCGIGQDYDVFSLETMSKRPAVPSVVPQDHVGSGLYSSTAWDQNGIYVPQMPAPSKPMGAPMGVVSIRFGSGERSAFTHVTPSPPDSDLGSA